MLHFSKVFGLSNRLTFNWAIFCQGRSLSHESWKTTRSGHKNATAKRKLNAKAKRKIWWFSTQLRKWHRKSPSFFFVSFIRPDVSSTELPHSWSWQSDGAPETKRTHMGEVQLCIWPPGMCRGLTGFINNLQKAADTKGAAVLSLDHSPRAPSY